MNIVVNGKSRDITEGYTVQTLLEELHLDNRQVVVERNQAIVPREQFAAGFLADGDTLEIVHFVGGG